MGCGSSSGALPFDRKISVTGDVFSTDTRNLLTVLEIGEIHYRLLPARDQASNDDITEMTKHVPILEDLGRKTMGGPKDLLLYSSFMDQRNAPKLNEKGKLVKPKKGTIPAKALVPVDPEQQLEMERLADWFLTRFRPHSQHLFNAILYCLQFETVKSRALNQETALKIEESSQRVVDDMDFIHQCLMQLNKQMGFRLYIGSDECPTIVDVMIYNELSQVLHLYHHFRKTSKSQVVAKLIKENPDACATDALIEYQNIEKWFNRTMPHAGENVGPSLAKCDKMFKDELDIKIAATKI